MVTSQDNFIMAAVEEMQMRASEGLEAALLALFVVKKFSSLLLGIFNIG